MRRTVERILGSDLFAEVIVVISEADHDLYSAAMSGLSDERLRKPVTGGDTRAVSVANGLSVATGEFVAIHDAARPLVSKDDLHKVMAKAIETGAAFLALPTSDAVWQVEHGLAWSNLPRETIWRAQTPQVFRRDQLLAAHAANKAAADDDVSVAVAAGIQVTPVQGSDTNIKLTQASDFAVAERILAQTMDIRTGNGFDVHKFGPGDHVILCGIKVPHIAGLVGHSDADVAMHAVTDAIFGALAEGDIGQWFPPSDPQWKGAASDIFLRKAVERATERGFSITNVDCTLICERPKIGPVAPQMRANLSTILGIAPDRVSVKATTSEKLGFTGREEGIAALASATLIAL